MIVKKMFLSLSILELVTKRYRNTTVTLVDIQTQTVSDARLHLKISIDKSRVWPKKATV